MVLSWFKSRLTSGALALLAIVGSASQLAAGQLQLPVPRVTIYPGQVIEQAMLVDRAFHSNGDASSGQMPSRDGLVGKVAKQTLLPGQPIYNDSIRAPHSVTQGQAASVIFKSGALTITASGIALQSGGTGDAVSVRNTDSGRIIKGTIGADGAVHVSDQ